MIKKTDVTISIVNYKSSVLVNDCIKSIIEFTQDLTYDIIVVDNNSDDDISEVVSCYNNVKLILNKKNSGFAAANNLALKHCKSKYFLLLNPDTMLLNNTLKILYDFMEQEKKCSVSCPQLYYPDGRKQQSHTNFRTPFQRVMWDIQPLLNQLGFSYIKNLIKNKFLKTKIVPKKDNTVSTNIIKEYKMIERPRGVCFFVRMSAIKLVGPMDERFFMYCEEVDWSLRFTKAGFKNFICFDAKVSHIWGGTSKSYTSLLKKVQIQSEYKYFLKHYGIFGFLIILFGNLFSYFISSLLLVYFFSNKSKRDILIKKNKFHLESLIIYFLRIKL